MTSSPSSNIDQLRIALDNADTVLIGAGAGLSVAAGFTLTGPRFTESFADFIEKYHFRDLYSAGFHHFDTLEEQWAFWSRHIFIDRYVDIPNDTYQMLYDLVSKKDYFVITTNVDHCFQKTGFDKQRLFYTQGDYGLWQCSVPCHQKTYDNEATVREMVARQKNMRVPSELIPRCPVCGAPMTMNLRCDDTFVEDAGWHQAAKRYQDFLRDHEEESMLLLELGVGGNTPAIIKYPFWRFAMQNPEITYATISLQDAVCPPQIDEQSICISDDINAVLHALLPSTQKERRL